MSSGGKGKVSADPMLEYANKALDLQKTIYDKGQQQLAPYYQAGSTGLNELMLRLGLTGSSSYTPTNREDLSKQLYDSEKYLNKTEDWATRVTDMNALNAEVDRKMAEEAERVEAAKTDPNYGSLLDTFGLDNYQEDPGYQFRLAEGNKALERSLNAKGKTFSPEATKALQSYGQGLASEEYGNAYNRFTNDQNNLYNRLLGITGLGTGAYNTSIQQGQNYANQATDLYTGMGNAITSANIANAQNKGSMFNNLIKAGGLGLQAASLFPTGGTSAFATGGSMAGSFISDKRLKADIEEYGMENGHKTYTFRYREDPTHKKYIGVMAQDLLDTDPMAVIIDPKSGYYKVNYGAIGVDFREAE